MYPQGCPVGPHASRPSSTWFHARHGVHPGVAMENSNLLQDAAMTDKLYSTEEAAEKARIDRTTLQKWLANGTVRASVEVPLAGGLLLHRWNDSDIRALKAYVRDHEKVNGLPKA